MTDLLAYRDRFPIPSACTSAINPHLPPMPPPAERTRPGYPRLWPGCGIAVGAVGGKAPALGLPDRDVGELVCARPEPDPSRPGMTYDRSTVDLDRVAGGKIVEHWDNVTKPAAQAVPQ